MGKRESMKYLVADGDGPNDMYKDIVEGTRANGSIVAPRGLETKEVRPVMIIFGDPRKRFLTCPKRNINPIFQVLESIWILGGRGDVNFITRYLKNMEKYSDGQSEFHAPYGVRMRKAGTNRNVETYYTPVDQFKNAYNYLKDDPYTRHAVMSFWNPIFDHHGVQTIDRPCNTDLFFLHREGELDLTICNRSNDIHFGIFNANVVQFSVILETMSILLGFNLGFQVHFTNSLHYYTENPLTSDVMGAKYEFNVYDHVSPLPFVLDSGRFSDPLEILDADLENFFQWESYIWGSGKDAEIPRYRFNYLEDVSLLSLIKFHLANNDSYWAIRMLNHIRADDIFVTTSEYLLRVLSEDKEKADAARNEIIGISSPRFQNKVPIKSLKKINGFISQH